MIKEIYIIRASIKADMKTGEQKLFFHETKNYGDFTENMDKQCYVKAGYLDSEVPIGIEVDYNYFYGGVVAQQGFKQQPSEQEKIGIKNDMVLALKDFLTKEKQKLINEFDEKIEVCDKEIM